MEKAPKPIYVERWRNDTSIAVYFHKRALDDEDESDRIELVITTSDGKTPSLLMNAEDAIGIIHGLSMGIQRVIDAGVSVCPKQE